MSTFALVGGIALTTTAQAQTAQAGQPGAGAQVDEVVVTGSRLARTTFDTPTPVTALGEKQLDAKAASTVAELVREVPALRPNRNITNATDIGISTFNLRGLGALRTLVLVDGRRVMDSSPTGGFDTNIIPTPLIKRVEIVTGGASSVYGSDAVTGVVNVLLDDHFKGGKLELQGSTSERWDHQSLTMSGAYGFGFASDRGHVVFSGSLYAQPDILYQGARDWGQMGYTLVPNAAYTPTNGQFRQLIVPNARLSQMTEGGLITSAGVLKNIQFGAGGVQSPFVPGTNVGTIWMQGGGGLLTQPDFAAIDPSGRRKNLFARVTYDLTADTNAFVELFANKASQRLTNTTNYNNADITIRRDNAFLPANIRAVMVANNLQTITVGRLNRELGINDNTTETTYIRAATGLGGSLLGWKWDASFAFNHALYDNNTLHNRINANWTNALDAVIGPNGQPICRSTLTNPGNGCVPANIFGIGAVSPEAVAYVTGTSFMHGFSNGSDLSLNSHGQLFATWAGPIDAAFGAEYRRETVNFKSDPISAVNGWRQSSSAPYRGAVEVREAYAELGIPLVKDIALARSVQLDLAGRAVDYSTSGSTWVWKAGLNWAINDQVRLRSTYSRDFRAPRINELFAASTVRQGTSVIDPTTNQGVVIRTRSGGNLNLMPEVAHTFTAGLILRPAFAPGLQVSADYYDIDLQGAITTLAAQDVVNQCAAGNSQACAGIQRDPSSHQILQVDITSFNASAFKTRGVDFEVGYRMSLDDVAPSVGGDLTLSAIANYVDRLVTVTNGVSVDTAGQLATNAGSPYLSPIAPHWRAAGQALWQRGPLILRLAANLVGSGKYDNTLGPLDLDKNKYPAYAYFDASAQYQVTERVQVFGKVENLFDTDPPLMASSVIIRAGAAQAGQFYDLVGRAYGVGIRYRW